MVTRWRILNYWVSDIPTGITTITRREASFYALLIVIALPFIWIGTVLTLRRLRDANLPLWLVALFFLPFFNLAFFIILVAIPSEAPSDHENSHQDFPG